MRRLIMIMALLVMMSTVAVLPMVAIASPNLQTGVVDDSMCLFNRTGTPQELVGYAKDMRSRWVRTNVYYKRVQGDNWVRYDRCVGAVTGAGLNVQLTIACNNTDWTPSAYADFVGAVVRRYKGVVSRISLCNEPNYPGWLTYSGNQPLAVTYNGLYQAGYRAAISVDPLIQVFWGELSSSYNPLSFMADALCTNHSADCQPTVTNCVAYHPYQQKSPDIDASTAEEVGIGGLWRVQQAVDGAFNAGMLQTPDGGKPPLCLTEFGYQSLSRARGDRKGQGLSDATRAQYLVKYIDIACHTKNVAQVILHQLRPSPPLWPGDWDTSLIGRDGLPDLAYSAYVNYLSTHPECVSGI